jgi:uncharacterized protein YegP (UPF0339 family)
VAFWIYKDTAGYWRWGLFTANNKKIAASAEGYHDKADCLATIDLVKGSASVPVHERSAA